MITKQEKIDATILGITRHPEIKPLLSKQGKRDITIMIESLANSLDASDVPRCCICGKKYQPDQFDCSWVCSWCR